MTPTSDTPTDARRLAACWACGADSARDESWLPAELNRCPSCGLARPAARGSQVLGRSGFWMLGLVMLALYAAVLVIVVTAH